MPERDRRRHLLLLEVVEDRDQRQVAVERRLADPVGAVRPAAMMQHPGQVAVQREDKPERHAVRRAASAIARA